MGMYPLTATHGVPDASGTHPRPCRIAHSRGIEMNTGRTPVNPFMQEALQCAQKATDTGDVPVGAVVVRGNHIIGRGWNSREADKRVLGHAELMAIEDANRALGSWRLDDCEMYVTLEPCAMCASAIIQARMRAVYFGTWDRKAGAAGSVMNLFLEPWMNHRATVYEGIMEQACKALLDDFFKTLRHTRRT